MPDPKSEALDNLRRSGVQPKGMTGCSTCDASGFPVCKCKKGGGAGGGGQSENEKTSELHFSLDDQDKSSLVLQRKALALILTEFNRFKTELKNQGIPLEDFLAHLDDKILTIIIPNPALREAFMERLKEKKLLPNDPQEQSTFNPTPFSMKLTPGGR